MKQIIYTLILALVGASGLVFANHEPANKTSKSPSLSLSLLQKRKPH
jgi:hypothetical protein